MKTLGFPLLIEAPSSDYLESAAFLRARRGELEAQLLIHGAIRVVGAGIDTPEALGAVCSALFDDQRFGYAGGDSPRTRLSDRVYTSTEFPAEYTISQHNELSYAARWPAYVLFCCAVPCDVGGETPITDGRAMLRELDPALVEEFDRRGVTYVRNLHDGGGFGRSWQSTFETDDRSVVARVCDDAGATLRWAADGGAQIRQTRPALATHPRTGERVWFNQAEQFHPSTYPQPVYAALTSLFGDDPDRLPSTATFGDGGPISMTAFDEIRRAAGRLACASAWRRGDLLWLDNMLSLHGRNAFRGERRILVAMA